MDATTERRILGLVGLGIRARNAVVGVEQVRLAARKGKVALAIVAPDASPNSLKKLLPLLAAKRVQTVQGPDAVALGGAAGRESTAAIAITDPALARGLRKLFSEEAAPAGANGRRDARTGSARKGNRRDG
ncbi:MAG TPA: ribosomal L7Ae/L30e/S12e/Gadd45 family protein [Gemmatimonadaceae bacterium]